MTALACSNAGRLRSRSCSNRVRGVRDQGLQRIAARPDLEPPPPGRRVPLGVFHHDRHGLLAAFDVRTVFDGEVMNVIREGGIINPDDPDPAIQGTRRLFEKLGTEPRLEATALQTVGCKKHDGFAIAIVKG